MSDAPESCATCPFGTAKEGREALVAIREAMTAIRANHSSLVDRVDLAATVVEKIGVTLYGKNGEEEGLKVAVIRARDRLGLLIWIFGIAAVALLGNVIALLLTHR